MPLPGLVFGAVSGAGNEWTAAFIGALGGVFFESGL
jgi:hypothetical protein